MDAFLIHNSRDKDDVERLKGALEKCDVKTWLDDENLLDTKDVQIKLSEAFRKSKKLLICLGPSGIGDYQKKEMSAAVDFYEKAIVVLLPGCTNKQAKDDLLIQLLSIPRVKFGDSITIQSGAFRRLVRMITGYWPIENDTVAKTPTLAGVQPDNAISNLVKNLKRRNITFFVGPHLGPPSATIPPGPCELTEGILEDLGLITAGEEVWLLPSMDHASGIYLMQDDDEGLIEKLENIIKKRSIVPPDTYNRLADLINKLKEINPSRVEVKQPQLIFTTNFDLLLEWSLFSKGMGFTRMIMNPRSRSLMVMQIKQDMINKLENGEIIITLSGAEHTKVCAEKFEQFAALIRNLSSTNYKAPTEITEDDKISGQFLSVDKLSVQDCEQPIIFKYGGSIENWESVSITTVQYFVLARLAHLIPRAVKNIIGDSSSIFLGYSPLDTSFLLEYQTILSDAFSKRTDILERYTIRETPNAKEDAYRNMESAVWSGVLERHAIQTKIQIVASPTDTFLQKLYTQAAGLAER